jgi:hypothetical protein
VVCVTGFRKFMTAYVAVILAVSVFSVTLGSTTQSEIQYETTGSMKPHFSVHWMGFAPTDMQSTYPDYAICVNDLAPTTLSMSIAVQIKNQEDKGYFFRIAPWGSQPAGWNLPTSPLSFVNIGETYNFVYQPSRTKPTSIPGGALKETISMVVGAYRDSGLTDLYSQDNFTATFRFLDRTSTAWSTISYNNFDDGTVQGWSAYNAAVDPTYYRSFPYSLRAGYSGGSHYFEKTFSIGAGYGEAYLIYSLKSQGWSDYHVNFNSLTYFRPDSTPPTDLWLQFALPLGIGQTTTVRIDAGYWSASPGGYSWLDNVYVIAK